MGAYMDFDRTADRGWSTAEYLVKFGQHISQRTVDLNYRESPAWRFTGKAGLKPYLTQRQYEMQTPGVKKWYEPLGSTVE